MQSTFTAAVSTDESGTGCGISTRARLDQPAGCQGAGSAATRQIKGKRVANICCSRPDRLFLSLRECLEVAFEHGLISRRVGFVGRLEQLFAQLAGQLAGAAE